MDNPYRPGRRGTASQELGDFRRGKIRSPRSCNGLSRKEASRAIFIRRRRLIFGGGGSGGLGIEKGTNFVTMIVRTAVGVVVEIVVSIVVTIVVVTIVVSFCLTRTNLLRERIRCFIGWKRKMVRIALAEVS